MITVLYQLFPLKNFKKNTGNAHPCIHCKLSNFVVKIGLKKKSWILCIPIFIFRNLFQIFEFQNPPPLKMFIVWCCTRLKQNTNPKLQVWWFNDSFKVKITGSLKEPQWWNLKSSQHVARNRRRGYQCRLFWYLETSGQCYDAQPQSL